MSVNLLYKHDYKITDDVSIVIPTVGEILNDEDAYYGIVSSVVAMPIDMCVQLYDVGIDFTEINEYDLFLMMLGGFKELDTSLVFKDIDLKNFQIAKSEKNDQLVLIDQEHDIVIDRAVYDRSATLLRKIHGYEKDTRTMGNEDAKKYFIERARKKLKRSSRNKDSQLEPLIVAMVNTEQFKYDYDGVLNLTIYQFNECVRQIIKKVDYDNRIFGIYSGTISAKDIKKDELNWLVH